MCPVVVQQLSIDTHIEDAKVFSIVPGVAFERWLVFNRLE